MNKNERLTFGPSDIKAIYNDQAISYLNFTQKDFGWDYLERPLLDKVLSLKSLPKNPRILDAGCGMGRTLRYLIDKGIPNANIVGIDISNEMLIMAQKNVPEVRTINADVLRFSTKERFDLIICVHVLHYLDSEGYQKALLNFYKLLNSGGILFFIITHPDLKYSSCPSRIAVIAEK